MTAAPISVLVVDDSPVVRQVLSRSLAEDARIGAVHTAPNGSLALRKIAKLDPDVVTLDVDMPDQDGLAVLGEIMDRMPRPVIMVSAATFRGAEETVRALELGAVDFVPKPAGSLSRSVAAVTSELIEKIHAVAPLRRRWRGSGRGRDDAPPAEHDAAARPPRDVARGSASGIEAVVIGASTGGTEAVRQVLTALPADFATAVLVVQHMPEGFTASFAKRLDELCALEVKEAAHRDLIRPGRVLLAPGHSHMIAVRGEYGAYVELRKTIAVSGHRPSVDVLFESAARAFGCGCAAVLLTGMGRDGATGMARLHAAGALTVAQDAASCVVFGMPKAAIDEGSVQVVAPLSRIGRLLLEAVRRPAPALEAPGRGADAADQAIRRRR